MTNQLPYLEVTGPDGHRFEIDANEQGFAGSFIATFYAGGRHCTLKMINFVECYGGYRSEA